MAGHRRTRALGARGVVAAALALAALLLAAQGAAADHTPPGTYRNPVQITIPGSNDRVETFADPAIIRGDDGFYYAYGTSDPLNERDRDAEGNLRQRRMPIARSADLVHWTYVGDVLAELPAWMDPKSMAWAPDIRRINGRYHVYFTATNTLEAGGGRTACDNDSAIGVATSDTPAGPFVGAAGPAVAPRPGARGAENCDFLWTFDPAMATGPDGTRYLYYGSYYGGVQARVLSADGLTTDPATATQIVIGDRYEGTYIVQRDGWYYYMGSATDCCRGPLTGYSVFAGRSKSPLGPFVDRSGNPLTDPRVGGSTVISMNGNRWMGPGHNSVITDDAGQDWFVYHATDRLKPFLGGLNPNRINQRPMLIDRLDWVDGWPTVRNGHWASDSLQPAPITVASHGPRMWDVQSSRPRPHDRPGGLLSKYSDNFSGGKADPEWTWVRQPAASLTARRGFLRFPVQAADLFENTNTASIFSRPAPEGDFMVQVKFDFDLPPEGNGFNYQQAGLLIYENDDAFVKLVHASIWGTRQTEWAKEVETGQTPTNQRYGNSVIGPPGPPGTRTTTTYLRIVRRIDPRSGLHLYTGYSSYDGRRWERGATWTHLLENAKIGLVSMGLQNGEPHTADFDYVRTFRPAPKTSIFVLPDTPAPDPGATGTTARVARKSTARARGAASATGRQAYSRRFAPQR